MKQGTFSPDELKSDFLAEQSQNKDKDNLNRKKNEYLKKKGLHKDLTASDLKIFGPDYFLNYELSWLKFNDRVLQEAENKNNKLLERVNFISIVCSNLDEFFQKRVGGLKRQQMAGVKTLSVDGLTPADQLKAIRTEVFSMMERYRSCFFDDIVPELEKKGIRIRTYEDLNEKLKIVCDEYFARQIYPIITPLAVDESHPFPFISNQSLSFAVELRSPGTGELHFSRIKIPPNRPRFITVSKKEHELVLIPIDDLIASKINLFFPGMEVISSHVFRVTRNASLERNEEEAEDLLEMIEVELRERRFAEIVRLEIDKNIPEHLKKFLEKNLKVRADDIYEMSGTIGLADVNQISRLPGFTRLKNRPWVPVQHPALKHEPDEEAPDIFDIIKRNDFLVHHPYHSFELTTQHFIEAASKDPKVLAIKQTLYRTSEDSPLMQSLMAASESGKQVAVLVEIQARFDEQRNINWAQKLENSGVHVAYGLPGLKIHAKVTMVVRDEEDGLRIYCHIGTGNYHPVTAKLYEDMGLFTCDERIGADVADIFNLLTGYAPDQSFDKLLVAPKYLRKKTMRLIAGEIEAAEKGKEARIVAKMNSLEDTLIIQELYKASAAGVKTDLIVRGVCRLIPQKPGLSENINVHSVIGRFLEHSRIYYFANGGANQYSIGSADWMHRNLDARVEALTPVSDPGLKKYLQFVLKLYLDDNTQRWLLNKDGEYIRVSAGKKSARLSAQETLMAQTGDSGAF